MSEVSGAVFREWGNAERMAYEKRICIARDKIAYDLYWLTRKDEKEGMKLKGEALEQAEQLFLEGIEEAPGVSWRVVIEEKLDEEDKKRVVSLVKRPLKLLYRYPDEEKLITSNEILLTGAQQSVGLSEGVCVNARRVTGGSIEKGTAVLGDSVVGVPVNMLPKAIKVYPIIDEEYWAEV